MHPMQSLHKTLGQLQEDRKEERKKEFNLEAWGKGTSNTIIKKKKRKKRQSNTAQMKEQTRNTHIQINKKEIGKLPEKVFRIMIVKMIKNLEKTKWRKCKNQLIKTQKN